MKSVALIVLTLCSAMQTTLASDGLGDADRLAIRSIIRAQINAFRSDDAPLAYSYAAPAIQRQFSSARRFMSMVRQSYAPVYRPKALVFNQLMMVDELPAQRVTLLDQRGMTITAVYPMTRLPDGSWRIAGCFLVRTPAKLL